MSGLLLLGSSPTLLHSVVYSGFVFGRFTWPHSVQILSEALNFATTTLQLVWLAWLLNARTQGSRTSFRASLVLAICSLGVLTVWGVLRHPDGPYLHEYPVRACLLAWLCYEVYRWHGIPLSAPASASTRAARWDTTWQMTQKVVLYCLIGASITYGSIQALRRLGPHWLPVMRTSQLTAIGASASELLTFGLVWTVVLEGSVIGATAILLSAARRPPWQIYCTIAAVEIVFHAYLGVPALLISLYAIPCTHFYLRHHQIVPLLAGHGIFDTIGLLSSGHSPSERLHYLIPLILVLETGDRWLAAKAGRRSAFIEWPRLRRRTAKSDTASPPADTPAADRSTTTSGIS
ncbi:hypothetical protein ACF09H_21720 [Streptomyces sp. NPDC014983]|uniref:hypothetical protein n=1 Tax=Streptomyces sp. NPDC014983 TaxID=3364933 RepID=UPI0036FABCEE